MPLLQFWLPLLAKGRLHLSNEGEAPQWLVCLQIIGKATFHWQSHLLHGARSLSPRFGKADFFLGMSPSWQSCLLGKAPFLAKPPSWQSLLLGKAAFLTKPLSWQSRLLGKATFLAKPPFWQAGAVTSIIVMGMHLQSTGKLGRLSGHACRAAVTGYCLSLRLSQMTVFKAH